MTDRAAPFDRGEDVVVTEEGIRPWGGTVLAVKWSPRSGWWCEVDREDGSGVWYVRSQEVRSEGS